MQDLDFELSTSTQEWLNALKGCLCFHFWEETITVPLQVGTESRNDFELSNTLHAGMAGLLLSIHKAAYFVKLNLRIEHTKTVQWYVTKKEFWKCSLTVDFKVCLQIALYLTLIRSFI